MAEITTENVDQVFRSANAPDNVKAMIKLIEDRYVEMATTILTNVPHCAQRTLVLRYLQVSKHLAVDATVKGGMV